jgi:RNA 3'-terminal phosphate cyclase (ATP)
LIILIIQKAFLPCLEKMGPKITAELDRPGFYPAGGGAMSFTINPISSLKGLRILERGELKDQRCTAMVAKLDPNIGHREIKVVREKNFSVFSLLRHSFSEGGRLK